MTNIPLLIPMFCGALGMAISILLLFLLSKQAARGAEWANGILLGSAVLLMYTCIFVLTIASSGGVSTNGMLYLLSSRITLTIGTFIPAIILFGWKVSSIFKDGSPVGSSLFRFSLVTATVAAAFIWFTPVSLLARIHVDQIVIANGLLVLLPGFRGLWKNKLSPHLRLCMGVSRWFYVVGLVLVPASATLATSVGIKTPLLLRVFLLVAQQMGILVGILGSFIFTARFRFADLFVKWSVRLAGLGILATVGAIGLAILPSSLKISDRSYLVMIDTVGLFVLMAVTLVADPAIDRWAQEWILQQADFKGELEQISLRILTIDSEQELLKWLDRKLIECLELTKAQTIPRALLPGELANELSLLGDVLESHRVTSLLSVPGSANVEVLIPIMVDGQMRYVTVISVGLGRSTLLSGEVQFLRAIIRQVGVRIDHIESEAALRQQALRESLLRNQLTEAELRALRAQVNPHFLFNSLNTIADFIVTNPVNAERMTLRLASIFRHVLAQSDRQFVTLHEEFDFLRNYLQIEQERFGARLSVSLTLDPSLMQEPIPTLLLQPIVENALKHGLSPKPGNGTLEISAARRGTSIELVVLDNGMGYYGKQMLTLSSSSRRSGVGLANTAARLNTIYGDQAALNIESGGMEGCRVSITYPLYKVSNDALSNY